MITAIKVILDVCEKIMRKPKYVTIHNGEAIDLGLQIRDTKLSESKPPIQHPFTKTEALKVLLTCSIDYCFWYGTSYIRPNESSSEKLFNIINYEVEAAFLSGNNMKDLEKRIKTNLSLNRFPLMEERGKHINEILQTEGINFLDLLVREIETGKPNINKLLETLIIELPGFGGDMFLKRACLFFILLKRIYGILENETNELIVPADYQVPKVLCKYNILKYSPELMFMISDHQLIPKGSLMEIEIRAATILACNKIKEVSNVTIEEVDNYLWNKRKQIRDPFHLTITTDY
jgi:hypothetical protein